MDSTETIVGEVERKCGLQVVSLLREGARQPRQLPAPVPLGFGGAVELYNRHDGFSREPSRCFSVADSSLQRCVAERIYAIRRRPRWRVAHSYEESMPAYRVPRDVLRA